MINFAEELEKQRNADEKQGAAPTVKEYKLAEGIYFQDFRPQKQGSTQQSCFEIQENQKKNYVPPRNPVILEADFKEFQKRIDKMKESIEEIISIDDWKDDKDFREAVEEDYQAINNNYIKQLNILQAFEEIDPCCDLLKKDTKEQIEQSIKENKLKQTNFLKEMYGLKGQVENNEMEIEKPQKVNLKQKQQKEEEEEDNDQLEDEDIQSIQDQLNKQKLDNNYKKDNNDDDDDGVYL